MELELNINGVIKSLDVAPNESLLTVLRREGYYSVKHGCESGECGACTVLVDGLPRPSCVTLAAQAGGCSLTTAESLGNLHKLHPLQEAFIDTGAIQCGFCTPGMLLSASALLKHNPSPTETEVREALSGNLCRCTGYARPVQAVLRAAAVLRGESVAPLSQPSSHDPSHPWNLPRSPRQAEPVEPSHLSPMPSHELLVVGKSERGIDAVKLATGKPTFVDDIELRDMLYARILTSPHAHALIREIDISEARALPGVQAVLTYKDVSRVPYTSAGQPWPEPGPHDQFVMDNHVRFVGDRIAAIAAETAEIAEQALQLIKVDYEVLPAVLDPRLANSPQAPCIHPETESYGIYDAAHNIAAYLETTQGDVERGFAQADLSVESEYVIPAVQYAPLENQVAITYWDENDRLVVRTSSAIPYHVRRILSPLTGLSPRQIRVVAPRTGGDQGVKHDVVIEDLCAMLTIATSRPVRLEYTRAEEFRSSRVRHAQVIRVKTGVKKDGTIVANSLSLLANTGAYGTHARDAITAGMRTLSLYRCANLRFDAQVVYTNQQPAGDSSGGASSQGFFALENHIDEVARQINMDALELRRKNWIKEGDDIPSLGNAGDRRPLRSCGLPECLRIVEEKLQWKEKRGKGGQERFRRGVGAALATYDITGASRETGSASLKLNEDGSFNLLVGAVKSGNGSDTLFTQIAAEILGVSSGDIILHTGDTDFTPFDTSSSISICGGAVGEAAELVSEQILIVAGQMLKAKPEQLSLKNGLVSTPGGQSISVSQVALQSFYVANQRQIAATASWTGQIAQPSFVAQGAEVEVDTETGVVRVLKAVTAVDTGRVLNPVIIQSLIDGAAAQALGHAISEEMLYDQQGCLLTTSLSDYRILSAPDVPELGTYIVETEDPSGPFGAKDIKDIANNALAPAIANAVADALGVRIRQIPLTPERILRILRSQAQVHAES